MVNTCLISADTPIIVTSPPFAIVALRSERNSLRPEDEMNSSFEQSNTICLSALSNSGIMSAANCCEAAVSSLPSSTPVMVSSLCTISNFIVVVFVNCQTLVAFRGLRDIPYIICFYVRLVCKLHLPSVAAQDRFPAPRCRVFLLAGLRLVLLLLSGQKVRLRPLE